MANHFPTNNFSAPLRESIDAETQEIRLDVGSGSRLKTPCWVSIDDEIIDIGERQRAWSSSGLEGVNRIFWGAMQDGAAGNGIVVALVAPGVPDSALSVVATDNAVSVSLATDFSGVITSAVEDVLKLVRRDVNASRLVQCYAPDEVLSDIVAAETVTLAGGDDDILLAEGEPTGRGAQGTAAASHAAGAKVEVRCTAELLTELAASMNTTLVSPIQFAVHAGAPVLDDVIVGGTSGFTVKAWKFPQGEEAEISLATFLPDSYGRRTVGVIASWFSSIAGGGSCHWRMRACAANSYVGTLPEQSPVTFHTLSDSSGADTVNMAAAFMELPGRAVGDGAVFISIGRAGANPDDTLAGDAYLYQVILVVSQ